MVLIIPLEISLAQKTTNETTYGNETGVGEERINRRVLYLAAT